MRARAKSASRRGSAFLVVGLIAFAVDLALYNALRLTVLQDAPIGAKVASMVFSMTVAWLGNRYVVFSDSRGRPVLHEALLFFAANLVGLGVAALCLYVSHYVLGYTSPLADNISGNGVGLVLATAVRFLLYRTFVFRR